MLAAKHFDPIVGIDIHIIQPPGPVPPVPIPHPFVGFLIDPADYVPIIGSTVQINGMHRAQAGTAGKCVPPHIPIGGMFVPPLPGNECEMFMGSATVEIDGDAQSYMSLPALSCQSVGMPSIPRISPKKKTVPKCLMLPTSLVLPIPAGPPVMIGGPPTISIMGLAMKAGMAALGKLAKAFKKLQKGSKRWKALSDRLRAAARKAMDKLGIPPSVQNKVSRAICAVTGHPVDIATGKVFTDAVDFELPGPLPLKWERVWYSTSIYQGPLGYGWHHGYDLALVEEDGAVVVRMADGRSVTFPVLPEDESSFDRKERLTLYRDREGYGLRDTSGLAWRFGRVTFDTDVQALLRIENRVGDRIEFTYDKYGHLELIIDSASRKLPVRTDDAGRILEIRAPHPDEANATISMVSYDYDEMGRMMAVRDALNQPVKFRYQDSLLVQETDRTGLSFYFEYDGTDEHARCVHTWGDGGIYERRLDYNIDLRQTVVTNSLGHQTTHFWNSNGLVYRAIDALGNAVETVFNEFNQSQIELNELGLATVYEYDERGNQTGVLHPDGSSIETVFNELDLPVRTNDRLGNMWHWEYNARGQLLRRSDATGRVTRFQYNGVRLSAIIDPADNTTEFSFDGSGNVAGLTTNGNHTTRWQFDSLGRPFTVSDATGNTQRRTFDLLGRLTRVVESDGSFRSRTYDAAGNVIHYKDLQHDVRFTWQGMGRLATRREAGTTVEFRYNTEDDLIGVVNEHGHVFRFELDARGHVAREYGFDDIRRVYTRDEAGRVIRFERASGLSTHFEYDVADRVTAVRHSDGAQEKYVYRADGELIEASNSDCKVGFERDQVGRVTKEWQNDYWVSSTYDSSGLRTQMMSCFGTIQRIERNAMGDVLGIQYVDAQIDPAVVAWKARIQRDEIGRELQRWLPGGIQSRWDRDKLGRPIRQQILGGSDRNRDTQYVWYGNDRLKSIVDTYYGTTVYEHDEAGRLVAATYGDGVMELRMPDSVGNLFRTRNRKDRKYGKAGELLESRTDEGLTGYEYDAEGNLIRKSTPQGDWIYTWNAAGMLVTAQRPDGEVVEFCYDPLGRRISKTFKGQTTRWIWDGNNPLHEWIEGTAGVAPVIATATNSQTTAESPLDGALVGHPPTGPPNDPEFAPAPAGLITWLFDPESFALAAKVEGNNRYSIVTDYLGTPTAMFDAAGRTVWSANISIRGNLLNVAGDRHACPFRWQGQYEDKETGLYYNRFRYYDPDGGAFISEDPIGLTGGLQLYGYVSDPLSWIDPWGLDGTYTIDFSDGTKYHGKGPEERMRASARRELAAIHATGATGVTVTSMVHTPASSARDAFKEEARRISVDGGVGDPSLRNRINSPGKKYKAQDCHCGGGGTGCH